MPFPTPPPSYTCVTSLPISSREAGSDHFSGVAVSMLCLLLPLLLSLSLSSTLSLSLLGNSVTGLGRILEKEKKASLFHSHLLYIHFQGQDGTGTACMYLLYINTFPSLWNGKRTLGLLFSHSPLPLSACHLPTTLPKLFSAPACSAGTWRFLIYATMSMLGHGCLMPAYVPASCTWDLTCLSVTCLNTTCLPAIMPAMPAYHPPFPSLLLSLPLLCLLPVFLTPPIPVLVLPSAAGTCLIPTYYSFGNLLPACLPLCLPSCL